MVDVGFLYHSLERILDAARLELRAHVLVPEVGHSLLLGGKCIAFL